MSSGWHREHDRASDVVAEVVGGPNRDLEDSFVPLCGV
jgi:hypothetical protein